MSAAGARERDPHFQKILEGLAGHLDPQAFEECVQDLLRDSFPSLAGVHGGSDTGMDGAIADGEGEPFALIATTEEDVIGNFTRSLRARLAAGDTRRKAVVATSESLSPRRRRNLQQRARELGFALVQTFDRRDIATRLYHDSRWTKTLLGITGEPPALSAFPRTRRPLFEVEPVGRDADLDWLRRSSGDRLLVGEPGSGKTFLLLQMVREDRALFLASEDEGRFAHAYRNQRPEMVLVDDAHIEPERLNRLRQIRYDIHGDFAIVATSWKGHWEEVADALGGLPEEQVHHLNLLTRAEILEVLRGMGVQEPDDDPYLAELVNQAANRPGLAVTLGTLWLRGAYREVLTGQALLRSLVPALGRLLEQDPTQLLAAFALGGNRGMGLEAVAEFLGSGIGDVWETAGRIGASGVLRERGKDRTGEAVLAVNPTTLRAALLHEVFFSPSARAWEPLLRRAPSLSSAIETLVLAADRDVPVPRPELRALLREAGSPAAWHRFAALGEAEGAWALEHYPGPTAEIASQALDTAPGQAILRLLQEAEEAAGSPDPLASKPLETLRTWIEEVPAPPEGLAESLRRRRHVVTASLERRSEGGNPAIALRAAFLALAPRLESTRQSVAGGSLILRHGSLPASAVPEILELWQRVRDAIPCLDRETWRELDNALHWWIHPNLPRTDLGEDELEPFHRMARRILTDLVPFAEGRPGLASALVERASELDLDLQLAVDPIFRILYPGFPRTSPTQGIDSPQEALCEAEEAARALAADWARRPPADVVDDLSRYAEEVGWGHGSLGTISDFEEALAREAKEPEEWLKVLLEKRARPSLVRSFLFRVVEDRASGWEDFVDRCLQAPEYAWAASEQVLRLPEPPDDLLDRTLEEAEPQLVETACLQGRVVMATLRRLITHSDSRIAVAAAVGEWLAEPRQVVRPEIQQDWRQALLKASARELEKRFHERYWLKAIFSQDPELALDWLRVQLAVDTEERPYPVTQHGLIPAAIRALDASRRARLLTELAPGSFSTALLSHLVSDSSELYRKLLNRTELQRHHLAPLAGKPPDSDWVRLARLALDGGHDPREIAASSFHFVGVFSPSVEHYAKWETAFRRLSKSKHLALQEVARHGLRQAERLVEGARGAGRRLELKERV